MDNVYNLVYNCTFIGFVDIICVDIVVYNIMCISRNFVNCVYDNCSTIPPVPYFSPKKITATIPGPV